MVSSLLAKCKILTNVDHMFITDLIASAAGRNAEKEKRIGLELLHSVISGGKKKVQWTKSHELLMKKHVDLCVDLKDHRTAKDGLHQYRNLCQNVRDLI